MITEENAAQVILSYRVAKNVTQEELSKKTGISVQTLRHIEKTLKKPQTLTLYKLEEYFKSIENK